MELKDIIKEIEKLEKQFREEVQSMMTQVPEANGVRKINENCFVINFKSLNNTNLNPEHYDTQKQIKVLREKIEKCKTADEIKNRLQEYINTKTLEVTKGHKILLHDFVLEKLNEIVFKL